MWKLPDCMTSLFAAGVVLLRVNSEWVNGTISANSDGTLDLEGSKLYFGGVHPDIDPAEYVD